MKRKINIIKILFLLAIFTASSCTDDESERLTFPLSAEIFHSIDDKQVAFTALTHSATSWSWDFDDGNTSAEQSPLHNYESGGFYTVTLTASDGSGNSVTTEVQLSVAISSYILLTGGPTDADGKTWKLSAGHSGNGDYFANADADFSEVDGVPAPLPTGIFDTQFGMGAIYGDEFTFHHDGSYEHGVKTNGASFGGYVYALVNGIGVDNDNAASFGLCTALYTPDAGATFTYVENENFDVPSVYSGTGVVTYSNVATLDFSGTEFVGFRDFQRKVILRSVGDNTMQLVMFMAASPDNLPLNTHALILSFELVN